VSKQVSVHSGDTMRSLDDVKTRAACFATGMDQSGIGHGDRIAIIMRNEITFLELTMAAGLLGATPVPINWHWAGDDLAHALSNSGVKMAIAHTDLLPAVQARALADVAVIEAAVPAEVSKAYGLGEPPLTMKLPSVQSWAQKCDPWVKDAPPAPMSVIYSSGTTGQAKGILRNPIADEDKPIVVKNVADLWHLAPGESTLIPAPLYHSAPNVHASFAAALGMNIHIMPRFDGEEFLRIVHKHRINSVQMVPTMFTRLLQLPEHVRNKYDVSSLRAVVHAASPCPTHIKQGMIDWFGPIVYEYYGGAEIGAWTAADSTEALSRPGTVGRPILDSRIRILDSAGQEKPPGEDGIIYGRNFTGWPDFTYIDDHSKRQQMEVDGYLTLGDIGRLDADGYLYLSDRLNDMVISGGVNIYPAEIEASLLQLDAVVDVAVFGIPDATWGESLAAHIQLAPDAVLSETDVQDHVKATLADYKVPREVVFVTELPREDTGKLFKRLLQEKYWPASDSKRAG